MAFWLRSSLCLQATLLDELEVDLVRPVRVHTVQQANVTDAVERNTHSNLELGSWQVDAGNHLSCRMLDLETRIKLEEVEFVVCVRIEVLHCSR